MTETGIGNQEAIPQFFPKTGPEVFGVRFFFATRHAGVSQGRYSSLNVASHVGDDWNAVQSNRLSLITALKQKESLLCLVNQVHGSKTVVAQSWSGLIPDADALVSRQPGIILGVVTADCVPVLFADPVSLVVGAAHAGWRGSVAGVLESCLEAMEKLGADYRRIEVRIGPCIRKPVYEVNLGFKTALMADSNNKILLNCEKCFSKHHNKGTLLFDLPKYVNERLLFHGLLKEKIYDVAACTYQNEDLFFSHRRASQRRDQVPCGRQISGVFLV